MSGVRILHFLKDWWKCIQIHQYYVMAKLPPTIPHKVKGHTFSCARPKLRIACNNITLCGRGQLPWQYSFFYMSSWQGPDNSTAFILLIVYECIFYSFMHMTLMQAKGGWVIEKDMSMEIVCHTEIKLKQQIKQNILSFEVISIKTSYREKGGKGKLCASITGDEIVILTENWGSELCRIPCFLATVSSISRNDAQSEKGSWKNSAIWQFHDPDQWCYKTAGILKKSYK